MNENALALLFRTALTSGLTRQGQTIPIAANYQPTTQGRNSEPTIYFHALPETRYGWQYRERSNASAEITTSENQWMLSGYQVYALAEQDPLNINAMTAKDIINLAAMICNSEPFVAELQRQGVGIQRITQVRNPYFVNDQGQFESSPSFDVILTHKRSIIEVTHVADPITCAINRV